MTKRIALMLTVAFAALCSIGSSVASAQTAVQRPFPQGISTTNANKAWDQVKERATYDASYARAIAVATGSASFNPDDYTVKGYGKVSGGTNSATVTSTGATIPVGDTHVCKKGAKALILEDEKTGDTVEICTGCGNVRVKKGKPRPVRWQTGTTLKVNRNVTLPFTGACPGDGRLVTGSVTFRVSGKIKAKSWGKVSGKLQAKIKASYKLAIKKGKVVINCAPLPTPPLQPVTPEPAKVKFVATAMAYAYAECIVDGKVIAVAEASGFGYAESETSQQDANDKAFAIAIADARVKVKCSTGTTQGPTKDGRPGAGAGNSHDPINGQPGAGDSGTAPSAECWLEDGNGDPKIKGRWDNPTQQCVRIDPALAV